MKILTTKPTSKNEKGIALIFSLIMLSLLLIMALSFALDSMYDQKAAYNSANVSSAGFSAKDQLSQIILLLENNQANFQNSRLYSIDSSTTQVVSYDMLTDILPVDNVLEDDDDVFDFASATATDPKVNWNYIRDANNNNQILGRTAFVVVPKEKIPLNSLLVLGVDESAGTEARIGKDVAEINVEDAYVDDTGYPITTTILAKLSWKDIGKYDGSWGSYDSLFSTINISDDKFQQNFKNSFSLEVENDQEAFWADLDGDTIVDSGEIYNRFNLARTDWDSADNAADIDFIREKILCITNNSGTNPSFDIDKSMEAWDGTNSNGTGLPWIACFGYNTDGSENSGLRGTFSSVKDRRHQIAANLKDYCDNESDPRPTSDVDPSTWATLDPSSSTAPTYTGNEKTPYINQVGVKIVVSHSKTGTASPYSIGTLFKVYPCFELAYPYGSSYGSDLVVHIKGNITVNTTVVGGTNSPESYGPVDFEVNLVSFGGEWIDGYSKFVGTTSYMAPNYTVKESGITGDLSVEFEVASLNITKVALYSDSTLMGYDYVKNLSQSSPISITLGDGDTETFYYGFAAHDPRQNLNGTTAAPDASTDWLALTPQRTTDPTLVFSIFSDSGAYYGKPNSLNNTYGGGGDTDSPSAGSDLETVSDPANGNISTAHIRNAPMESPWELGFIHRGAKWETLNLKAYDTTKAYQITTAQIGGHDYIPGGGTYASGDANILDQVKMTSSAESPEKINIGTQKPEILKALFSKIYLDCNIDSSMSVSSMASGGTDLSMTDAERTTIMNNFASVSTTNRTRACIAAELTTMANSRSAATDAVQEELIGKMVNLTKVAGQGGNAYYTVIVAAQTIKDIGLVSPDEVDVTKTSADGSLTHAVSCQIGRLDIYGSNADWKQNVYGDEITATQKIIAEITKDAEGKITVKNLEYVE